MKIVLVSYSGTSASILKDRMSAWAHANLVDAEIIISSLSDFGMAKGDRVMQEALAEIRRYKEQLKIQ